MESVTAKETHVVFIHTHPVQYQVPIYRMLQEKDAIRVTALFFSDHSIRGGTDRGFGQAVKWDVPMLEGYAHQFLENEGVGNEATGFRSYRFPGFHEVFSELKPDVVLLPGYGFQIYWQAAAAAKRLGIPVAVRPECVDGAQPNRPWWKSRIRDILLRYGFFRNVDLFLSTGHFSRLEGKRFGFDGDRLGEALYCIDTDLFEARWNEWKDRRDEAREALGMRADDLGVVFMAKFIDWKNPSLILRAMETVPEEDRQSVFPILVGSGPDFEKVKSLADQVCGEGRYACPGFVNQSELCRYYAAADLAVLPSKRGHESWGLVVNEAMTCGLPVAVSDGVGSRVNLVEGKGTGWVFRDGDAEALGRILMECVANPSERKRKGGNAKQHIAAYGSRRATESVFSGIHNIR